MLVCRRLRNDNVYGMPCWRDRTRMQWVTRCFYLRKILCYGCPVASSVRSLSALSVSWNSVGRTQLKLNPQDDSRHYMTSSMWNTFAMSDLPLIICLSSLCLSNCRNIRSSRKSWSRATVPWEMGRIWCVSWFLGAKTWYHAQGTRGLWRIFTSPTDTSALESPTSF